MLRSKIRFSVVETGLVLAIGLVAFVSMVSGAAPIPMHQIPEALMGQSQDGSMQIWHTIIWDIRLPRFLLAAMCGGALAMAGSAYQSLFRNPLADPFVIGASSGAALGATVAIALTAGVLQGAYAQFTVNLFAFFSTLGTVAVVYMIGGTGHRSNIITLLLAGAAISTLLGSLVSLIVMLNDRSLSMVYYWLLGGVTNVRWLSVGLLAGLCVIPAALLLLLARPMDAMNIGEHTAHSLGLPVRRLQMVIVVCASILTAASVSVVGVVGFIGLIPPHMARSLVGGAHRRQLPASMLLGALLLSGADLIARTAMAPLEIPVGILTAMLGAPFFLYILRRGL